MRQSSFSSCSSTIAFQRRSFLKSSKSVVVDSNFLCNLLTMRMRGQAHQQFANIAAYLAYLGVKHSKDLCVRHSLCFYKPLEIKQAFLYFSANKLPKKTYALSRSVWRKNLHTENPFSEHEMAETKATSKFSLTKSFAGVCFSTKTEQPSASLRVKTLVRLLVFARQLSNRT